MIISALLGVSFVLIFLVLILLFILFSRKKGQFNFRDIVGFTNLRNAIGSSVESGKRIHVSLGWSDMSGRFSTAGLAGLSVLERIGRVATISDKPPVATSGDPVLAILSQDTLKSTRRMLSARALREPDLGLICGLTPFSFAVGAMPVISEKQSIIEILIGHFGVESALILDASERHGNQSMAGSDQLPAQAILYAAAQDPLIGEDLFAAGAYLRAGSAQNASLHAQDVMRWLLILILVIGSLLKILGVL
jgi:hypothetical protein